MSLSGNLLLIRVARTVSRQLRVIHLLLAPSKRDLQTAAENEFPEPCLIYLLLYRRESNPRLAPFQLFEVQDSNLQSLAGSGL